ncbi:MAG: hypothetical protein IEMM0002_0440 [bacterium]|nr:MAG: hypothetical protein IEMM0002_0440 [bacterium]
MSVLVAKSFDVVLFNWDNYQVADIKNIFKTWVS